MKEKDLVIGKRYILLDPKGRGEAVTHTKRIWRCPNYIFYFQADKLSWAYALEFNELEKRIRPIETKPKKCYLNPRLEKKDQRWSTGKLGELESKIEKAIELLEKISREQNLIPEYDFYNWDYESWDLNGWHDTYTLVRGPDVILTETNLPKVNRTKSAKIFLNKIHGAIEILQHFNENQSKS
jgi:hypothetical protein